MGGSGNSGPAYALVDAHLGGRIYRVPTKVGTYQSTAVSLALDRAPTKVGIYLRTLNRTCVHAPSAASAVI